MELRSVMAQERKNKYAPDMVFPPGETLKELLGAIGMSEAEFAERMDAGNKEINSILQGDAPVKEDLALRMERVLGVPASFWKNLEQQYRG